MNPKPLKAKLHKHTMLRPYHSFKQKKQMTNMCSCVWLCQQCPDCKHPCIYFCIHLLKRNEKLEQLFSCILQIGTDFLRSSTTRITQSLPSLESRRDLTVNAIFDAVPSGMGSCLILKMAVLSFRGGPFFLWFWSVQLLLFLLAQPPCLMFCCLRPLPSILCNLWNSCFEVIAS